ncbi:MAG: DUF4185 domain-containing protein [Firmicutes bacterium]|nr:DUF4185 domain-containing protein [Bacillota bacterium]
MRAVVIMIVVCILSALVIMVAVVSSIAIASDEFSGTSLDNSWKWVNPKGDGSYSLNAGRFNLNVALGDDQWLEVNGAPRILKMPLPGDWVIDTNIVANTAPVGGTNFTGLVVFKDAANWILWGQLGNNNMEASGLINNAFTGLLVSIAGEKYDFLRIRKRSTDSGHTRYYFDYSADRLKWTNAGCFEDTGGKLTGAHYGIIGKEWGSSPYTVSYDYFAECVPAGNTDNFDTNSLDRVWNWENPSLNASYNLSRGSFSLNIALDDDQWIEINKAPRILRSAMVSDWIIDTLILDNNAPVSGHNLAGLVIFKDAANWFLWGQLGNDSMEASGIIDNVFTGVVASHATKFSWLRIKKNSTDFACPRYYFEGSNDGVNWTGVGYYDDKSGALNEARYGVMGKEWGTAPYTVSFSHFRERRRPTGTALKDVSGLTEVAKLTGPDGINATDRVDVIGTDLGSMVEVNGTTYMMFGDTFSYNHSNWRSNTMAYTTDPDPADGLSFSGWITDEAGKAKELIPSIKQDYNEMTCIPTNLTNYDNRLYAHFMSVYHWGAPGHWDANFAGWAYSDDGGKKWAKSANAQWTGGSNFIQVAAYKVDSVNYPGTKDILLSGIPTGRFGGVKLARVNEQFVLAADKYEYFAGTDGASPVWSGDQRAAVDVVPAPVGELSVLYNNYLGRWIITYLNEYTGDIEVREAANPWGPWSDPEILVDHILYGGIYAPFMVPAYVGDDGRIVYFTMSMWGPYNVFWMKATMVK